VFKAKKLYAKHFEHKDPDAPKVFISELKVEELSERPRPSSTSWWIRCPIT
jgi:hypothetical protein